MEQRNKTFTIRTSLWILLGLFVFTQLGDIITTLILMVKHFDIWHNLEIQPLFVLGVPQWLLMMIKGGYIFMVSLLLTVQYPKYHPIFRYLLVYGIIFITLLSASVMLNNISFMQYDTKDVVPIPKEQRIEVYSSQVADLEVTENLVPEEMKGSTPPLAVTMFIWNFIIFIWWRDIDKGVRDKVIQQ